MPGPLDISYDTTQTKTAIPLIRDGEHVRFRLSALTLERTEKGPSTKWVFDQQTPAPDTEGGTIAPGGMGAKQFVNIQLYSKPDSKDPGWFIKKICQYTDALLGTSDPGNKKGKPERPSFFMQPVDPANPQLDMNTVNLMIGQELVASMKVKQGDYIGNEFGKVTFPGDISA